jgi:hypothetical protein
MDKVHKPSDSECYTPGRTIWSLLQLSSARVVTEQHPAVKSFSPANEHIASGPRARCSDVSEGNIYADFVSDIIFINY